MYLVHVEQNNPGYLTEKKTSIGTIIKEAFSKYKLKASNILCAVTSGMIVDLQDLLLNSSTIVKLF